MQPAAEEATRNVAFCPHCGNLAPQRLVHTQNFRAYGFYLLPSVPRTPRAIFKLVKRISP